MPRPPRSLATLLACLALSSCDREATSRAAAAPAEARQPAAAQKPATAGAKPSAEAPTPSPAAAVPEPLRLATPRTLATGSRLKGGRILLAGGLRDEKDPLSAVGDAEVFDPYGNEGAGRMLKALPFAHSLFPGRAAHAAVELEDGRVLLCGGSPHASLEVFDPDRDARGAFDRGPLLPGGPRAAPTATRLLDGRVLVAGGTLAGKTSSSAADLVEISPLRASALPPLRHARHSHTATLLEDGRVWLAGGVGLAATEFFAPEAGAFAPGPELASARDDHSAVRLADGRVLVLGGQDEKARTLASAECLDPRTNRLRPAGRLHEARADAMTVLLPDGRVLVMGGEQDDGGGEDRVLGSVEVFDPRTDAFERARPLRIPRDDGVALRLGDGRIVLLGGQDGRGPIAELEFYSPD